MTASGLAQVRFVRRTRLGANEYRKNFRQIDADVISAVTSPEADRVTPLMSKIYLRLASAPTEFWESDGVLYFGAAEECGRQVKASKVLYQLLGVASATAHKALAWMHGQGIIGYSSGKNGAGIRIFLNRAASSIGLRDNRPGKKILTFARGSNGEAPGSLVEPAFKDSFAVQREVSDLILIPGAPENGADTSRPGATATKQVANSSASSAHTAQAPVDQEGREPDGLARTSRAVLVEEIVERLKGELEPCVKAAAAQAASREIAHSREWFETKALPKAVRVAQHETYGLLRKHRYVEERSRRARADFEVGHQSEAHTHNPPRPLTTEEVLETAETCVALLEAQGRPIEVTLSGIGSEGGGWLLSQDIARVREAAQSLLLGRVQSRP